MKNRTPLLSAALAAVVLPMLSAGAHAASTYVDFAKNNNIYTNLNQEFPNTGAGVPGSGVGVANASYLYDPYTFAQTNGIAGSDLVGDNGVNFNLTSDASGYDFAQIGGTPLAVGTSLMGATSVYLLMGAYDGVSFNATFTGSGGASETVNGIYLPDFNGGGPINSCAAGVCDQTVFRVTDVGAGGTGNSSNGDYNNYDLTEVGFTLSPAFQGQTLTGVTISSNGYETLLLGITAVTAPVPEPETWALMAGGLGFVAFMARRRRKTA